MKKLLLIIPMAALLLASCGGNDTSLNEILTDKSDFDNAANSFADGNAKDGEEYFAGLLAEVIKVDVKYHMISDLDEMNASEKKISAALDSVLFVMKDARKALNKYKSKNWPNRAEFHDLTLEWFDAVEELVEDYARPLVKAMAKADEDLTDDEIDLYVEWEDAYSEFLNIDQEWVDFQRTYASANGFQLSDETIDTDALKEEELANQ